MAIFYWRRSKLAIKDLYSDHRTIKDGNFEPDPDVELRQMDIEVTDEDIDKMMNYKPSPSPDPDTLSMEIWSNVYNNNHNAKMAIRALFRKVFDQEFKIPGLKRHDVTLHLKVEDPKRQKDLRPVGSLMSVPKRMLKISIDKIKKNDREIFYGKNDYSAPKRGTQKMVIVTYENLHSGYYGIKKSKRK